MSGDNGEPIGLKTVVALVSWSSSWLTSFHLKDAFSNPSPSSSREWLEGDDLALRDETCAETSSSSR